MNVCIAARIIIFKSFESALIVLVVRDIIPHPQEQESCRRQSQRSSTLCGCLWTQPIWWCALKPFYLRYFVFISNQKSYCCFCVFVPSTPAKSILFRNHRNRKVVGGNHNVLVLYVDVCSPIEISCIHF